MVGQNLFSSSFLVLCEFPFELAGDVVTQDLGRMLPSFSGGDVSGMLALIQNEQANEWVRSVAIDGLVALATSGQRTRTEIMAHILQLFHHLERQPGPPWDGLAGACADLGPQEAIEELRRAYSEGLVDESAIAWQEVEEALALGQEGAMERARYRDPLITDLAKDMGWMQGFHDGARKYDTEPTFVEELLPPIAFAHSAKGLACLDRTFLLLGSEKSFIKPALRQSFA